MAIVEIPTRSDVERYKFTIDLDGTSYGFAFHYNDRMSKWIFDITLDDGTPIIENIPVYVNEIPLSRFQDTRLPPGTIMFIDTSGASLDPGRDDLGTRVLMVYLDSSEVI